MKLYRENEILIDKIKPAKTFIQKLRGKFFVKEAVFLQNCNSIHTIFMRKNIDVVFLDKNNKVIKTYEKLIPRCVLFPVLNAKHVIEFEEGFINDFNIKTGDTLILKD